MTESDHRGAYRDLSTLHTIGFAHELANVCDANLMTLFHARAICADGLEDLTPQRWENLRAYVEHAACEAELLHIEAMNLLSALHEDFKSSLSRPLRKLASPTDLVRELIPMFASRLEARGIEVLWDSRGSTPIPAIYLDVHATRRALFNILSNAIKYSYASGAGRARFIRIRESLPDPHGPWWQLMIENYGVGILEHEMPRVFEPGYRGSLAIQDNVLGAGIGLFEAKRCMESIGGRIRLISEQDHDDTSRTRVILLFPRRGPKP